MGSRRFHSVTTIALSLALVSSACSAGDTDSGTTPRPATSDSSFVATSAVPERFVPTFEPTVGACAEVIDVVGGDIECGFVVVPADYDDPAAGQYRLSTVRLSAVSGGGDPIVYLGGRAGGHGVNPIRLATEEPFRTLHERHDLIVFDPRGAGRSEPVLDCPGFYDPLDDVSADPSATAEDGRDVVLAVVQECADRLRADGIRFHTFGTDSSAEDVEMIRQAFGIERWHLFGASYGTRLGQEVMRRHPESVVSAVLDSALPPDVIVPLEAADYFGASLAGVADLCEAEPACAVGPDLDERFGRLVDLFDADPRILGSIDPLTGRTFDAVIDGDALVRIVANGLYNPFLFTDLPELFTELEAGETDRLGAYDTVTLASRLSLTIMAGVATTCRDDVSRTDAAELEAGRPADHIWARFHDSILSGSLSGDVCEILGTGAPDESSGRSVTSDIPTLVLAGELDPVFPVSHGERVVETLSAGQLITIPGRGHAVAAEECVARLVGLFLSGGNTEVPCLDDLDVPVFVPGSDVGDVDLRPGVFVLPDTDRVIETLVPESWRIGAGGFDMFRERSLLDDARMTFLAGSGAVVEIFLGVVEDLGELELGEESDVVVGGETWSTRTGRTDRLVADVFWRPDESGLTIMVAATSGVEERDALLAQVVEPVLAAAVLAEG